MDMNPFEIMKNAKALQEEFGRIQKELASERVIGSSGGGIVKVTLNGQFDLLSVDLDPIAVDPRDILMLQDLIVAAHANAVEKVKDMMKSRLGPLGGGFPGL